MGRTAQISGRASSARRKNRAPPPFGIAEKAYNIRKKCERRFRRLSRRAAVAERRAERRVKRRKNKNERAARKASRQRSRNGSYALPRKYRQTVLREQTGHYAAKVERVDDRAVFGRNAEKTRATLETRRVGDEKSQSAGSADRSVDRERRSDGARALCRTAVAEVLTNVKDGNKIGGIDKSRKKATATEKAK